MCPCEKRESERRVGPGERECKLGGIAGEFLSEWS